MNFKIAMVALIALTLAFSFVSAQSVVPVVDDSALIAQVLNEEASVSVAQVQQDPTPAQVEEPTSQPVTPVQVLLETQIESQPATPVQVEEPTSQPVTPAPVLAEEPNVNTNNTNTNNNNNNNGGNGGSGSNDDDDDNNGRRPSPITLPLEDLSTDINSEEEKSGFSAITGAVIGAIGKKGLAGIIILAVILAVAGVVVYNRRKLGVVKAK